MCATTPTWESKFLVESSEIKGFHRCVFVCRLPLIHLKVSMIKAPVTPEDSGEFFNESGDFNPQVAFGICSVRPQISRCQVAFGFV